MTQEQFFSRLWDLAETWGPLAIGMFLLAGLLTFGAVAVVFVTVIRQFRQFDRDWNEARGRMRSHK